MNTRIKVLGQKEAIHKDFMHAVRIGETIAIGQSRYKVDDVIWHADGVHHVTVQVHHIRNTDDD